MTISPEPGCIIVGAGVDLFRIHKEIYQPFHFCPEMDHRFDLDSGACYMSESQLGAFMETLGRMRVIDGNHINERKISGIEPWGDLLICDLTLRENFGLHGYTLALQGGPESSYGDTQEVAADIASRGCHGVRYHARHDPAARLISLALFSPLDPVSALPPPKETTDIPQSLINEALKEFWISVSPAITDSDPLPFHD